MTNELDDLVKQIKIKRAELDVTDAEYKKKFEEALAVVETIGYQARGMASEYDELTSELYDSFVTAEWNTELRRQQQDEYYNFIEQNKIEGYMSYGAWLPSDYRC